MEFSDSFFDFIENNANSDINALRLKLTGKKSENSSFPLDMALVQIEARKKTQKKLPYFLSFRRFIFPTLIAAEQASNEAVARFHASLIPPGSKLLDLTAGLGIDDMTFARTGIQVSACEIDEKKCAALEYNAFVTGLSKKLKVEFGDSIKFLGERENDEYDIIFADPARRGVDGSKVHALSDCQPDVMAFKDEVFRVAPRILIKTSPLLDLSFIISSLENLSAVYVVCFKNECKELLLEMKRNPAKQSFHEVLPIPIIVVDLEWEKEISRFSISSSDLGCQSLTKRADRPSPSNYKYIYEPNSGIMKTLAWNALSAKFPALEKAETNTHLFLSDTLYPDFPGRILQIDRELDKKDLKKFKGSKFNIVSRNHPLSAPRISSRFSIISGGRDFIYAFRYAGAATMLKTSATLPIQE